MYFWPPQKFDGIRVVAMDDLRPVGELSPLVLVPLQPQLIADLFLMLQITTKCNDINITIALWVKWAWTAVFNPEISSASCFSIPIFQLEFLDLTPKPRPFAKHWHAFSFSLKDSRGRKCQRKVFGQHLVSLSSNESLTACLRCFFGGKICMLCFCDV